MPILAPIKGSVSIRGDFVRPLLNWDGVPARFFEAVYDQLGKDLYIKPSDFVDLSASGVADARVIYKIFGGNRGIAITSEGFIIEIPDNSFTSVDYITQGDEELVNSIVLKFAMTLTTIFPEFSASSVTASAIYHSKILSGEKVEDILLETNSLDSSKNIEEFLGFPVKTGLRYRVDNTSENWTGAISIDFSDEIDEGLFTRRDILFRDPIDKSDLMKYFQTAWHLDEALTKVFNLEYQTLDSVGD